MSLPLARQRGAVVEFHPRCPRKSSVSSRTTQTQHRVARKISGVSNTTVGKIAKAAGITLAGAEHGKRLSAEKRAHIIAALKANPNEAEVAKQIGGVTHVGVWKIAKVAGIRAY